MGESLGHPSPATPNHPALISCPPPCLRRPGERGTLNTLQEGQLLPGVPRHREPGGASSPVCLTQPCHIPLPMHSLSYHLRWRQTLCHGDAGGDSLRKEA